jgi:hypothetical protein
LGRNTVTKLGVFSWEPFFEINNTSKQDITVTGLETLFDSVEARGHSLRLKQVERNALFLEIYENLGNYVLDNGGFMANTSNGQAGANVGAPPFYRDLVVPHGLTFADLDEAAQYVWDFNLEGAAGKGDPKNEYELVAKVYEHLKVAAARNSANL